jgi:RHS repeat-associated protein
MFRDFTTDLENKLVSALPINAGVRTLSYDPLNRLDVYNPGTAKRFIYDGAEVATELDSSGNIVGRYVRGDGADEIITGYTSSNPTARGWYHLDQRNSVIAVTDPNGVVTVANRYDEYGQPQGGNYGTFQYTGQMWLGEIGVYNYKARMYWPNERPGGRFMQADPAGYGPGMNRYVYVNDNPVNAVDPSGREGRAFSGIDADDRFPSRDFTPQGTGWGRHSYDWAGQTAWSALDQREYLAAQAAAAAAQLRALLGTLAESATSHDYALQPTYLCPNTSACVAAILQTFPSYVVPNLNQRVSNGQISPVYRVSGTRGIAGHVLTIFSDRGFAATNFTLPDHDLCCGRVDIRNYLAGNSWFVTAHGYGSNYFGIGWANQLLGPGIFGDMLGTYSSVVRARFRSLSGN